MKKRLLILPLLAGFALSSCSLEDVMFWQKKAEEPSEQKDEDKEETKAVTSVKITGSKSSIGLGDTLKLSVTVSVTGDASKDVTWSSSNSAVATVSNGTVTGKSEGTVTITATSVFDTTKSDSVTIKVEDQGWDPTYLNDGYTYAKAYPAKEVSTYLGVQESEIVVPTTENTGFYYKVVSATEESAGYIEVVINDVVDESYQNDMIEAGSTKFYSTSDGYKTVSAGPDYKFTVSSEADVDDEDEPIAPTTIKYYKSEEVWKNPAPSTDTAWQESHFDEITADWYENETKAILKDIPFLPIGDTYEISYADMFIYRMFGYDVPDYISIGDYSLNDSLIDGYRKVLTDNEFEYDEQEDLYTKRVGYTEYTVYEEFGEMGNTYVIVPNLAILDKFPTEGVTDFIENTIKSVKTLPDYTQTEGAQFTFEVGVSYDDDDEPYDYAKVYAYEVKADEVAEYANLLKGLGYSYEYTPADDKNYPTYYLQYGKICVQLVFVQAYDEASKTYSDTDGDLAIYITGDEDGIEIPGLYLEKDSAKIAVDSTYQLEVYAFELGENPVISYASSDESVATVDEAGLITGVAEGTAVITASTTYNEEVYEVKFTANVTEFKQYVESIDLNDQGLANAASVDGKSYSTTHGATISFAKGTAQSNPAYYTSGNAIRCYGGNYFTVSAPEGFVITAIRFTFGTGGNNNDIIVSSGTLEDGLWSGSASSVKFTISGTSGNRRFSALEIYFEEGEGGGGEEGEVTLESVCTALSYNLFEEDENVFEDDGEGGYYIIYTDGTTSQSTLLSAVEDAIDCLPDTISVEQEAPNEDTWDDGDDGVFALYSDESGTLVVEIGSYELDGNIKVQISVYYDYSD